MLRVSMICLLVATVALAVGVVLARKNNSLSFLLKTFTLIALVCLGIVVANYKDDFSGFSILVILSILPMFLALVEIRPPQSPENTQNLPSEQPKQQDEEQNASEIAEQAETAEETEETQEDTSKKKKKKEKKTKTSKFFQSNGKLPLAIALFLSAVCLSVSTLYVGKETFLGAILAVAIGIAFTFLMLALKKISNPYDILSTFLIFASIGAMVANIIMALLYSISLTNIMFCIGCLLFGIYAGLNIKFSKTYLTLIYYTSTIFLFLAIFL